MRGGFQSEGSCSTRKRQRDTDAIIEKHLFDGGFAGFVPLEIVE